MLPDFIGIGPARSATTWIYDCLHSHPEICMAKWDKKTHFFDLYFNKGQNWYEGFYSHCPPGVKRGELTETYIFYDEVPQRIYEMCPLVKILTCLRDPIERAFSAYLHLVRDGAIFDSFEVAIEKHEKMIVTDTLYYDHLKLYFDLFPQEQIHISLFDDLKNDQKAFLKSIYTFLEIDPNFIPPQSQEKKNQTQQPRFALLNKILLHGHFILRDFGLYKYLVPLKESKFIKNIRFKDNAEIPQISDQAYENLKEIFQPQVDKLSELIDRDLFFWMQKPDQNSPKEPNTM